MRKQIWTLSYRQNQFLNEEAYLKLVFLMAFKYIFLFSSFVVSQTKQSLGNKGSPRQKNLLVSVRSASVARFFVHSSSCEWALCRSNLCKLFLRTLTRKGNKKYFGSETDFGGFLCMASIFSWRKWVIFHEMVPTPKVRRNELED